jgi:hypothetical protein
MEQAERLANAGIQHKVWIEDDMAGLKILLFWSLLNFNERLVCIAVKPMPRQKLRPLIGNLPLYK